jgi:all-trans-8'-apo-beta-carotenal 15,15'-oxygenase
MHTNGMTRRQFGKLLGAAGVLSLVETSTLARAFADRKSVSALAYRTASGEGYWTLTEVEGRIPKELSGTLFRVCPGQRENHGVAYRHLFDGDAFVAKYTIGDGAVSLRARFVDTPQRRQEIEVGRMLYSEFGTSAPPTPAGVRLGRGKNQPSVNVIRWDGRLLGLSEGGHPTAIDPGDLSYQGEWDFRGTLPGNVPFTAHPKFDRAAGVGYGYGVMQGMPLTLCVYRMEADGRLTQLHSVPLDGYYMIHDMLLSAEHIVFLIPPVRFDFAMLLTGKATIADAVKYFEKEPTRLVALRRDGMGKPVTIELPASMVFHHGNAFERDGKLVFDSVLNPDGAVLGVLANWDRKDFPRSSPARLTRIVVDLAKGAVESRIDLDEDLEFPRFDDRRLGTDARFLYTLGGSDDPDYRFVETALNRHDLHTRKTARIVADRGRALGEPVFVPKGREDNGWLLLQGFDANRDRNYLEIRDAATLDFEARIWTPIHFPLGFHGNFVFNQR